MKQGMKIGLAVVGALVIVVGFVGGVVYAKTRTVQQFPNGFTIGTVAVGEMTPAQAMRAVEIQAKKIQKNGAAVSVPGVGGTYALALGGTDAAFTISPEISVRDASSLAARMGFIGKVRTFIGLPMIAHVPFAISVAEKGEEILARTITSWHVPLSAPQNAKFNFDAETKTVHVVPGVSGQVIDAAALGDAVVVTLGEGKIKVAAQVVEEQPPVTTAVAESLVGAFQTFAATITKAIKLSITDEMVSVAPGTVISVIQPVMQSGAPALGIESASLKKAVGEKLAPFEQEGKNAQFEWKDKRATTFVPHKMGRMVDWDVTAEKLFAAIQTASSSIAVAIKEVPPTVTLDQLNNLGINEEIGFGLSDFSGSPPGRIKNIKVGLSKLDGIMIPPGETFSLITNLLPIDAAGGYVQELVIKENKTIPEFGGGLCQIGTTTFRAAMGAGLPVVERRNHSYQVRYYFENGVSGTDATIYDPKPDFRFTNDTGKWMLFHTEMLPKSRLRFSMWGTSDGRVATRTVPKILSTQPAPPKQTIETTTLPVGKVKCTEKAHTGASTIFTYSVTYPDGTLKKQDFSSYYKPWAEVCLVGVAATSTPSGGVGDGAVVGSPDAAGVVGN